MSQQVTLKHIIRCRNVTVLGLTDICIEVMQTMINFQRNLAIVVITILCSSRSRADGNSDSVSADDTQPFVVDIRMPGVRTNKVG